ncbi:D-tagatose-bisphosphate aldolase, class II, non-catalytic subunit [Salinisphaera sp. LB1]|uniref:D-tagatose-bisphosphate aldolase, class II, non-catalytic subunit n=1 Tax=Salinisphaera sp. LB1 TaxID=2183911 RepID=UPI000D706C28|nr:D-tagatose-bisphosphate aldolase, class II, non-catalytic subunit [Salinisphaera sp. LB1]AWN16066.1 6-phosphofructokinase, PF08013 family [Salinisphaera sp. LB1]
MHVQLNQLARYRRDGLSRGITSICSAHPIVLRAALRHGRRNDSTVLIEATCNQVNHRGGYTGMKPADFAELVTKIAREEGCPSEQVVLGGDHLGPNPWRDQPAAEAMAEAESMIAAYVAAGFRKIHLDASMGCAGEPSALDDETTVERATRLAIVAEATARDAGGQAPVYIIGTEVPPPGGADHALASVEPTAPDAARRTIEVHRRAFESKGLAAAFERVIGLVVQPGVEFGNRNVVLYDRHQAVNLIRVLDQEPGLVFEAHSTDYQGGPRLAELVADGFAILKVGPELTFVLREALYGLDLIASDLLPDYGERPLYTALERLMQDKPGDWTRHYDGSAAEQRMLRHYSLSDRIRYYWAMPEARAAVDRLIDALSGRAVPRPLFSQHLPGAIEFAGEPLDPMAVMVSYIERTMAPYWRACHAD